MNQKGIFSIVIILIIVGVLIIGGGVWYWQSQKEKPAACTQDTKLCPDGSYVSRTGLNCEFAACPEVKDETADWQTYRNEEYGFDVKYPKDFTFQIDNFTVCETINGEVGPIGCRGYSNKEYIPLFEVSFNSSGPDIRIQILDNKNLLSLEDWYGSYSKTIVSGGIPKEKRSKIRVAGLEGMMMDEGCCETSSPTAYFLRSNKVYIISLAVSYSNSEKATEEIFKPILSTFKFTK